MSITTTLVPVELIELEEATARAFQSTKAIQPTSSHIAKIQQAVRNHATSSDQETLRALTRCYLAYIDRAVNQYIMPTRYLSDINIFTKLLITKNLVSYAVNDLGHASTLAGMCMLRALLAESEHRPHTKTGNISNIFEQWFGKSPPAHELVGAKAVSDYLYGEATWLLFHSEANNDIDRIRIISKQNLPFIAEKYKETTLANSTHPVLLPLDLS